MILRRSSFRSLFALMSGALCAGCAPPLASSTVTDTAPGQRRINEWAAALQSARFQVVEETGLRQPAESLGRYLQRIALPLPGEPEAACRARHARYVTALQGAVEATATARSAPPLRDQSPANRQLWRRAARDLSALPQQVARMNAAQGSARFGTELNQTMSLVLQALSTLRDARP